MSDQRQRLHLRGSRGLGQLVELFGWAKALLMAGHDVVADIRMATRSTAQNALFWSVLRDISKQVQWPVDGRRVLLEEAEWKDILSAGLSKSQRVAQGIDGGFVMLGESTSRMTIKEMAALIEFAHAFGTHQGVRWSRTSLGRDVPDEVCEEAA